MKQKLFGILSSYCLLLLSQGCTDVTALPDMGEAVVPIHLCARGGALQGSVDTRTEPNEAFSASVAFSTVTGNYISLSDDECEGVWKASVDINGAMAWTPKTTTTLTSPFYPRYGAYLYLVAYAPQAEPTNGVVTYTLSGQEDLLYVNELRGNCWDGGAFSTLTFNHLLTRLRFKANKKQADGLPVKITRVTVNEAPTQALVPLATGVPEFPSTATSGLSLTPQGGRVEVSSTTAVALGNLMLPPLSGGKYTLTVETSVGTYSDIEISYSGSGAEILKAGMSHEVTLTIADKSLSITSITVTSWNEIGAGDVEIGDRD